MFSKIRPLALALLLTTPAVAAEVRPVPPPGVPVPDADRASLNAGVETLTKEIDALRTQLKGKPEMLALVPDVIIFQKAVDWALKYDEFFTPNLIGSAKQQLELGMQRAKELREGKPTWNSATGLVVRGYVSKIDGSVQPYGLIIPEDWTPEEKTPRRLDFWFRGRAEKSTELAFVADRLKSKGEFTPPGAIVLHPYGRYCCANKFAGEMDLFEALENARTHYKIDSNRISVRGFSMGGASAWQFGTHFAGLWAAVAPGAGFGETAEFSKVFADGKTPPPWWEQMLWRWYDSTVYSANLSNTTTVAYSGEIDGQKQAADIMIRFLEKEGITIPHIIGPQTPHKYHADSKPQIEEIVTGAALKGREPEPKKVRFTTYTLIYPQMEWVKVDGLLKEWERADVTAEVDGAKIVVATKNVTALQLDSPFQTGQPGDRIKGVTLDGQALPANWNKAGLQFHREGNTWIAGTLAPKVAIATKHPEVCGPIDHAFMGNFVFIRPTGIPINEKVGAWTKAEMEHAITFWRKVFRGDVKVKDDTAITPEDVANSNLILWGDPSSNTALAKLLPNLPLQWTREKLVFGGQTYAAAEHAPVLIYPNPSNPAHYIVLNSGPTMREEALLNNAQQTAKLPDWAIINLNTPPDAKNPGEVVNAGFFDEHWHAQK